MLVPMLVPLSKMLSREERERERVSEMREEGSHMASIATDRGGEKNSRRLWPVYVSSFFPYFSPVVRCACWFRRLLILLVLPKGL
jgi:hypothetical protein